MEEINKIQNQNIISFDFGEYYDPSPRKFIDLADYLEEGFLLREKKFREDLKQKDWTEYEGAYVGIHCSTDAIIPMWAFMLVATKLKGIAKAFFNADENSIEPKIIDSVLSKINFAEFENKRVVVKGCGENWNTPYSYTAITSKLIDKVESLAFGEPCSMVPLFRKTKKKLNLKTKISIR